MFVSQTVQFPENHQSSPVYLMIHRRHTCHVSAPRRSAWIRFFIPRCFCLMRERMGGSSDLCKGHVALHTNAVFQASVITRSLPLMKTTQRELRGPKGEAGTRHDYLEYWRIGFPVSHRVRRLIHGTYLILCGLTVLRWGSVSKCLSLSPFFTVN